MMLHSGERKSGVEPPHSKGDLMPQTKDWPHAPVHRVDSDGIYIVTGSTLNKQRLFTTSPKLSLLENQLLTLSNLARLNYVHQNPVKHGLVPVANQYPWCSASWFERTASPAAIKTIYGFKIDKLRIDDDY
jgi:hypothetical protein